MAKALIQLALDSLDYDTTVTLAQRASRYVDCIEIGTPCLKVNGLALVKDLRARFPTKLIFADLKTMDAGYYEAEPFFKAGADITTVLGTADLDTIKGVIAVANKYGKKAQVEGRRRRWRPHHRHPHRHRPADRRAHPVRRPGSAVEARPERAGFLRRRHQGVHRAASRAGRREHRRGRRCDHGFQGPRQSRRRNPEAGRNGLRGARPCTKS
jgi:hypothetical protein